MAVYKVLVHEACRSLESNNAWTLILLEYVFTISKTIKQGEALEVRIGPLIKNCATFSSCTVLIVVKHLCFLIQHPPLLIDYTLNAGFLVEFLQWIIGISFALRYLMEDWYMCAWWYICVSEDGGGRTTYIALSNV